MAYLNLEISDTPHKRSYGLMDRKSLGENDGMIFIFPRKYPQSFWMQNTYLPLDIAFLEDDGKIFQIESMVPMSTRMTTSSKPCQYAVEVNKGWFEKNNIGVGFQMFEGDNWSKSLREGVTHREFSRFAQVELENEDPFIEPNELEGELTPEQEEVFQEPPMEEITPEQQQMYEQPPQPDQVVEYNMNQTAKIKFAEQNDKNMNIVYWTLSGKVLPPRKLMPVPGEGYPIKSGPNGRYFTAYDASPTINGNGWAIEGGTPKNFLIDNIISLEIETNEGETSPEEEQTIEEPQNLWDRLRNMVG